MPFPRETILTKHSVASSIFPEKIIDDLSSGYRITHLTKDALSLLLIYLNERYKTNVLCLFENEKTAKEIFLLTINGGIRGFLFFPSTKMGAGVPGFDSEPYRYRQETLISLSKNKNSYTCISTVTASKSRGLSFNKNSSISTVDLVPDKTLDRDVFIKTLTKWEYKREEFVYDPGVFSVRGDVVDLFPLHFKRPLRILFKYDVVSSICYFDIDTQRKIKNVSKISLNSINGGFDEIKKRGLLDSFSWKNILYVDQDSEAFSVSINKTNSGTIALDCFPLNPTSLNKNSVGSFIDSAKTKYGRERVYVFGNNNNSFKNIIAGFSKVDGYISNGFYSDVLKVFCLSNPVFGGASFRSRWSYNQATQKPFSINDLSTISKGDYLVHAHHGIGKYFGLGIVGMPGNEKECLTLLYKNNGKLFVPLEKLDLVHRYLSTKKNPVLNELGNKKWSRDIEKTKRSVILISENLLSLHADRKKKRGFSYIQNDELLSALEDSFPFIETPDQQTAINDVLNDMDSTFPMDRLICGDVGFGKTEVALRAIIKAAVSGKQTMLLCPTTILSDQHYITCTERLDPLGVKTVLLSRFKTKKEQGNILNLLAEKKAELVIGTHRLLSQDVVIPELSLLIIDEEHRFGVKHKETIRQLKSFLDVLFLSATPIPRTLQHSLVGVRDISKIMTPPKSRKPVITHITYFNWDIIIDVIQKELGRGGQVYYVHNNILSIDYHTKKLRDVFPRANIHNIHGRMNSRLLEKRILSFFGGKIDVLVCTTIIESGLDVTNANCIIINNAQKLGLSQLYQIRGRVGRGARQGSCFLLVPQKPLNDRAYRRLKTIEQHTSLGSGYDIALKDLEIRGAGSLFGHKQSGHITDVGFEMYCQLLRENVDSAFDRKRKDCFPSITFSDSALISDRYINNSSLRLAFYNKISKATSLNEIVDIRNELLDRFGPPPKETENLLQVSIIRRSYKNTAVKGLQISENLFSLEFEPNKEKSSVVKKTINSLISYKHRGVSRRQMKTGRGGNTVVNFYLSDDMSGLDFGHVCAKFFSEKSIG